MATTPNTAQRKNLADQKLAMPDGSFPIRDKGDLQKAVAAWGLSKNRAAAKAWIIKRATDLLALDLLPKTWAITTAPSASAAHSIELGEDFLSSRGIKL